jgi:hypothetical protein
MKEEINEEIEILKNNQLEKSRSISQIRISIKSLAKRIKQVKSRV